MKSIFETETYAIINNIDSSILKINPIIEEFGFVFIKFNLNELELNFSEVFNLPTDYKPTQDRVLCLDSDGFVCISERFENAISFFYTIDTSSDEFNSAKFEVFLLKQIKNSKVIHDSNSLYLGEVRTSQEKMLSFARDLVRKLRIFKKGQISLQYVFSIYKDSRHVIENKIFPYLPKWGDYKIDDADIIDINKFLSKNIKVPEILLFPLDSFENAYIGENCKLNFVLLMISLESLFNISSQEPIKHIISRHVALLLSENIVEFDSYYSRLKDLYNVRCDIVHGKANVKSIDKLNKNIYLYIDQLNEIVRKIFNKIFWITEDFSLNLTKDELFQYLNRKGFN